MVVGSTEIVKYCSRQLNPKSGRTVDVPDFDESFKNHQNKSGSVIFMTAGITPNKTIGHKNKNAFRKKHDEAGLFFVCDANNFELLALH